MFKNLGEAGRVIKYVLSKKTYFIVFLISSVISFIAFYMLSVATVANKSLKIFIMMSGYNYTFFSLLLLGIISLLFGIYMALFLYKIKIIKKNSVKSGFFSFIGLSMGLFSAGCPMCGAALFALIGMPLALFFLPFKGFELKILSFALLSISVYILSRSLIKCKYELK